MSIGVLTSHTPTPIIPVTDELIKSPVNVPLEQKRKIAAYNELVEDIYLRKTELDSLEARLTSMKLEIEGDIAHLALKGAEEATLKSQKRKSGTTAVAAFVRSGSPVQAEGEITPKINSNPNAAANGVAAAIANLKSVAGTTKSAKSRGKGKGRQERAKLNGTDLKYQKGRKIDLGGGGDDGNDYDYDDEEHEGEVHYGEDDETPSTAVSAN
ncbi:hypothetical protein D9756_008067 [Leucocoprinus leucothites]|uniref:Uncharacterized protein n=1 Tax=Leucocoprinus leucothites TaxID=201217 RepID=A0A8H5D711_9AGAR|nr:hypothetical protein D9756_008067 [Leucoagaricus leucothites]